MSKRSRRIARFIRKAMQIYPRKTPFAAITRYGAHLMLENEKLRSLPLAHAVSDHGKEEKNHEQEV